MTNRTKVILSATCLLSFSLLLSASARAEVTEQNRASTTVQNRASSTVEQSREQKLEQKKSDQAEKRDQIAEKKVEKVRTTADRELDRRIEDLDKLLVRIQEFKNLSDSDKSAITSSVNSLITDLKTLRTQIDTTTSTTTLKEARELITKGYRVYALAMPRLNIVAASDRVITMVSMLNVVGVKLEARLGALATSSQITTANIDSLKTTIADFKAKMTDAQTQAQSAVSTVANLVPDMGDKNVMVSNTKVLKDARAMIKTAQADLVAARKDAETILKTLNKSDKEQEKLRMKNASSTAPTN